jgi:hypothetical protein
MSNRRICWTSRHFCADRRTEGSRLDIPGFGARGDWILRGAGLGSDRFDTPRAHHRVRHDGPRVCAAATGPGVSNVKKCHRAFLRSAPAMDSNFRVRGAFGPPWGSNMSSGRDEPCGTFVTLHKSGFT